ncbi:unnamed protein product [Amoebophrya sp. A120]|nr:unnamed protein product [Amoebophrya sp. A120]|eukprot:GSA120T00021633001.1
MASRGTKRDIREVEGVVEQCVSPVFKRMRRAASQSMEVDSFARALPTKYSQDYATVQVPLFGSEAHRSMMFHQAGPDFDVFANRNDPPSFAMASPASDSGVTPSGNPTAAGAPIRGGNHNYLNPGGSGTTGTAHANGTRTNSTSAMASEGGGPAHTSCTSDFTPSVGSDNPIHGSQHGSVGSFYPATVAQEPPRVYTNGNAVSGAPVLQLPAQESPIVHMDTTSSSGPPKSRPIDIEQRERLRAQYLAELQKYRTQMATRANGLQVLRC